MDQNIICSGALFYATGTKRFLFLQRNSLKTRDTWGLVGGRARNSESAFEGLKREIQEEVGQTPAFKKVIPLELFTSNDQKFFFHTYVVAIESEFLPKLNDEHSGGHQRQVTDYFRFNNLINQHLFLQYRCHSKVGLHY